jgi:hypothetical protein
MSNLLTRRKFLSATGAAGLRRTAAQSASARPWNVLFILIDDMG